MISVTHFRPKYCNNYEGDRAKDSWRLIIAIVVLDSWRFPGKILDGLRWSINMDPQVPIYIYIYIVILYSNNGLWYSPRTSRKWNSKQTEKNSLTQSDLLLFPTFYYDVWKCPHGQQPCQTGRKFFCQRSPGRVRAEQNRQPISEDGTLRAWDIRMGARSLFLCDPYAHEGDRGLLARLEFPNDDIGDILKIPNQLNLSVITQQNLRVLLSVELSMIRATCTKENEDATWCNQHTQSVCYGRAGGFMLVVPLHVVPVSANNYEGCPSTKSRLSQKKNRGTQKKRNSPKTNSEVPWSFGPLVLSLVLWSRVPWSSGPLVPLLPWSPHPKTLKP